MFSSIVLAFAFVFGNSVRTVYESIIYLFVVHPFDVGDKIIVDSLSSKVGTLITFVLGLKLLQRLPSAVAVLLSVVSCCSSITSAVMGEQTP